MSGVGLIASAFRDERLWRRRSRTSQTLLPDRAPPLSIITPIARREAIQIAGTSFAGARLTHGLSWATPLAPVTFESSSSAFTLRSDVRAFEIACALFGGSPRLSDERAQGYRRVSLTGARFPGVNLPADVVVDIRGTGARAQLLIRLQAFGFEAEVAAAKWLAGESRATCLIRVPSTLVGLSNGRGVRIAGAVRAEFHPDWTLTLEGRGIARAVNMGAKIVSDVVTISLLSNDEPTFFNRHISRRALIELDRGTHSWTVRPPDAGGTGRIAFANDSFDRLLIETAETSRGSRYHATAFLSDSDLPSTAFCSRKGVASAETQVPLARTRFATVHATSTSVGVSADLAQRPTWVPARGCHVLIGRSEADASEGHGFLMTATDVSLPKVFCSPAILGVSAPMGDTIVTPIRFGGPTTSRLSLGNASRQRVTAQADLSVPPSLIGGDFQLIDIGNLIPILVIPDASSITVIRPDDLLHLTFEFYNLTFVSGAGTPTLRRTNTDKPAHLVVQFPPQHILEQAFASNSFFTAANTGGGTSGPLATKAASLISILLPLLATPPVKSRIAGPSRLAFEISATKADAGIPYTLASMLDWSAMTPSLVPAAKYTVRASGGALAIRAPSAGVHSGGVAPETYIEAPWGLFLSPHEYESWKHSMGAVVHGARAELWHTRLVSGTSYTATAVLPGSLGSLIGGINPIASLPLDYRVIKILGLERTVRAVWARDYWQNSGSDPGPRMPASLFQNSFTTVPAADLAGKRNRDALVDLTARYRHDPVHVRNLMLTSLGAWMDVRGSWTTDEYPVSEQYATTLMEWQHRTTMGRDQYVKIVTAGRLFPFGHKALLVTITERQFRGNDETGPSTPRSAFLVQRQFIIVREPLKTYDFGSTRQTRQTPFRRVEIKTRVTPDIRQQAVVSEAPAIFWPYVLGEPAAKGPFKFQIEATDWDGDKPISFVAPLIYVPEESAVKLPFTILSQDSSARKRYRAMTDIMPSLSEAYRKQQLSIAGQTIALAEKPVPTPESDTRRMDTSWMTFAAEVRDLSSIQIRELRYLPKLDTARVRVDSIEQLTSQKAETTIRLAEAYLADGYGGANAKGKVFAEIASTGGLPMQFGANLSGGVATPSAQITGLAAEKGAFAGNVDDYAIGKVDLTKYFGQMDAKLFGGISLTDLLMSIADIAATYGGSLGEDTEEPSWNKWIEVNDKTKDETLIIQYHWKTKHLKEFLIFKPLPTAELELKIQVRRCLTRVFDSEAKLKMMASLKRFKLVLIPKSGFEWITIEFEYFDFSYELEKGTNVDPKIKDIKFADALAFVDKLIKWFKGPGSKLAQTPSPTGPQSLATSRGSRQRAQIGLGGGVSIDIDSSGIKLGYTLSIPDATIGVFSLRNMSVGVGFIIPFGDNPVELHFMVCARERPFELTVQCIGGGGYFMLQVAIQASGYSKGTTSVKLCEVSLEFGAAVSFSVAGIASGMVEVKGGFIIHYEPGTFSATMFIRIGGALRILGIITLTIEFYLELKYEYKLKDPKNEDAGRSHKLTGMATLTVKFSILFISFSVSMTVKRELAGTDPRFSDTFDKAEWDTYCDAFLPARLGV